jgi:hypothetical protein
VFAGNHPAQILGQLHDAVNCPVGLLQHLVVVRVHRDIGVHVTIACVHVQCDEHASLEHLLMNRRATLEHRLIGAAAEEVAQFFAQLQFP